MVRSKSVDGFIVYKLGQTSSTCPGHSRSIEALEKAGITFHSLNEKIATCSAMGRFLNITASRPSLNGSDKRAHQGCAAVQDSE